MDEARRRGDQALFEKEKGGVQELASYIKSDSGCSCQNLIQVVHILVKYLFDACNGQEGKDTVLHPTYGCL